MLEYMRNKVVSVHLADPDTLSVQGLLDDDNYSLSELEILSIEGHWNRWTTPECPRAIQFLPEALGLKVEEGLAPVVHKVIGRKACRHFANLLLECCHTAREASWKILWERAREDDPDLSLVAFLEKYKTPPSPRQGRNRILPASTPKEPPRPPAAQINKAKGFFIDLHVHTYPASPCSSAPLDDLIAEAIRIGLDGICLTDHNHVWASDQLEDLRQKHGFLVLGGNEILTDQGDILVFGLKNKPNRLVRVTELREEVLRAGGFMIAAHPFRGFLVFGPEQIGLTLDKAMDRPVFKSVDALEVLNSKVTRQENNLAAEVASGLGLFATGGSDAHEVPEVGLYATAFERKITNEIELVKALKNGKYKPVAFRE